MSKTRPVAGNAACRVGIVVATWQNSEHTISCMESLLALTGRDDAAVAIQVVISDDHSCQEVIDRLSAAIAACADPRVSLVTAQSRSGYGASINRGIEKLEAFQPDFFWLLNNDTRVEKGALDALVCAACQKPAVGIWGATIISGLNGSTLECAGGYQYSALTTRNTPIHAGAPRADVDKLPDLPMDYVSGAAMFCRADLLLSLGGLSEDYFLYFEEQDFQRRMNAPVQLAWCRDCIVYHEGASTTRVRGQRRSVLQQYYENYSTLLFTRRHHLPLLPLVLMSRVLVKPCLYTLRREWHLFRPWALALYDFLRGAPPRRFD